MTADELQAAFARPDRVGFREHDGGVLIELASPVGRASLSLKGAQVLSFQPAGHADDLLWLSPDISLSGDRPIRGGIPICWPWFAAHPTDARQPAHGFARTAVWRVVAAGALADGSTALRLALPAAAMPRDSWPHQATLELEVVVGAELSLQLTTCNTGAGALPLSQALHAYLAVDDARHVEVEGLDGSVYLDKVASLAHCRQAGAVAFQGEVDRIYVGTAAAATVRDPRLGRRIVVAKSGSASTVVWNPGVARAAEIADIGPGQWRRFVCVETANAADDAVLLPPGASHVLASRYGIERP